MMINTKKNVITTFILCVFITTVTASSFIDNSQTNFDSGSYYNTKYNGSSVILNETNTVGSYTSRVLNYSENVQWNNISWQINKPMLEYLFTVDGQADIWQSIDLGTTWGLVKDDYTAGDSNGATDIAKNSSKSLFILYNQDIWKSDDKGITWIKVNDDYNGAEGQNGFVLAINNNNKFIIVEGDQDVWQSIDSGVSWTKVSTDFNGGNGNIFGITVNSSNSIFVVDGAADVWSSSNSGSTWALVKDDYNGATGNDATDMAINSSDTLLILHNQDVWQSIDSGVSWTKVNDDFNGAGDSNDGKVIYVGENDYIYIIDGSEDVYRSTNSGTTFSILVSNFNVDNGAIFGLSSLKYLTNLTLQVRNCTLSDCSDGKFIGPDGTSTTFFTNLTNQISLIGNYFQYRINFSTQDSTITPQVFNVTINYSLLPDTTPPTWNIVPEDQTINYGQPLLYTVVATDNRGIDTYKVNDTTRFSMNKSGTITNKTTLSVGIHNINISVNDTSNNVLSKAISIIVQAFESNQPIVNLVDPLNGSIWTSSQNVVFKYNVTDESLITNCTFIINDITQQINRTITKSITQQFNQSLSNAVYNWSISCKDSFSNLANSETYQVTVSYTPPSSPSGGSGGGGGGGTKITQPTPQTQEIKQSPPPRFIQPTTEQNSKVQTPETKSELQQDQNNIEQKISILNKLKKVFSITGNFIESIPNSSGGSSILVIAFLFLLAALGIYEEKIKISKPIDKRNKKGLFSGLFHKKEQKTLKEDYENLEREGFKVKKSTKSAELLETLQELKKAGNIEGSAVISRDGLIIASDIPKKTGAEKFSATSALMIKSAESALEKLKRGKLDHIIINAKSKKIIAIRAGNKGILVSLTTIHGNTGLILLEIKRIANKIEKILE